MNKTEIDSHYVDAISKVSFVNGVLTCPHERYQVLS